MILRSPYPTSIAVVGIPGSPVAAYDFMQGSGQTVTDIVSGTYNGTLGIDSTVAADDPYWTPHGTLHKQAALNIVRVPNYAVYVKPFTVLICAKVAPTDTSGTGATLMGQNNSQTPQLFVGADHKLTLNNDNVALVGASTSATYTDLWLVHGVSQDATTVRFYRNGTPDGSIATAPTYATATAMNFGRRSDAATNARAFGVRFGFVAIYDRLLSDSEVADASTYIADQMALRGVTMGTATPNILNTYLLDEGSGQTANDSSGNAIHAQLGATSGVEASDPAWSATGLTFASGDYLTNVFGVSQFPFTMSVVYRTSTATCTFIGPTASGGILFRTSAGNLALTRPGVAAMGASTSATYSDGAWHHACVTMTAAGLISFYKDGVADGTATYTTQPTRTGSYIGRSRAGGTGEWMIGDLAFVRTRDSAISASDVAAEYADVKTLLAGRGISLP